MSNKPRDARAAPSGEGERRAQRGYQQQYAVSAALIYAGLKNDELEWLGVADRSAGVLDDLVPPVIDFVVNFGLAPPGRMRR